MKTSIMEEKGSILIFSVVTMVVLILCASMTIDVSCILTARNQLQSAVDAAALAGATGLVIDQPEAMSRAISTGTSNLCIQQPVQIAPGDITIIGSSRIQVQANHVVNLFFARLVGIHTAPISAQAVAELGTIVGSPGFRPWGLPDMGWPTGAPVVLKAGLLNAPATNPSFFYPIDYPPLNKGTPVTGADAYRHNIMYGSGCEVGLWDEIQVEPGNMVGPTAQGVNDLIALDPCAYYSGGEIVNSWYPGTSSPRVVKIPLYNPNDPPDSGRNTITVIGLGAFFLEGSQGKDVIGRFMHKVTDGTIGNGYSFLQGVRLVS